jgi:mRNA interferase RelE/StbE
LARKHSIEYKPSAAKFIEKLRDKRLQRNILRAVEKISENPYSYAKLAGRENLYRARTGDFRIIYTIIKTKLIVLVLKIGHRKEIYIRLN